MQASKHHVEKIGNKNNKGQNKNKWTIYQQYLQNRVS